MKTVMKYILPPILVFLGVVALVVLVKSKPQAARAASEIKAPLVDFVVAEEVGESALVRGQGAVVSAREVTILPEVSGQVVAIHPNLVAGGRLAAGEVLLRIDPRDSSFGCSSSRRRSSRRASTSRWSAAAARSPSGSGS